MKRCNKCGISKAICEFHLKSRKYIGKNKRFSVCKTCKNKERIALNYSTKEGIELRKKRRKEARNKILEEFVVLLGDKCSKCKNKFPLCVYDFHHVQKKSFSISYSVSNKRKELILDELKKCILLCSNCHRLLHEEEGYKEVKERFNLLGMEVMKERVDGNA